MSVQSGIKYSLWILLWNFKQEHALRLIILILIGAAFNIAYLATPLNHALLSANSWERGIPRETVEFVAMYIVISSFYPIYTSLLFAPKRIVSPFIIQIITAIILIFAIISYAAQPNHVILSSVMNQTQIEMIAPGNTETASNLYSLGTITVFGLFVLGLAQYFFVRWLVGLNTEKALPKDAFVIGIGYSKLISILRSADFLAMFDLEIKRVKKGYVLIQSNSLSKQKHVITARGARPEESRNGSVSLRKPRCTIAILSFERVSDTLTLTDFALKMHENIIKKLKERIQEIDKTANMEPLRKDSSIMLNVEEYALKNTKSKIQQDSIWRYVAGGILIAVIVGILTYYHNIGVLREEVYLSAIVLIAVTILIEAIHVIRKPEPQHEDDYNEEFDELDE